MAEFYYSIDETRRELEDAVFRAGSATEWAQQHGFGQSFVCKVLRGELAPTNRLAKEIGLERVVVFRACNPENGSA